MGDRAHPEIIERLTEFAEAARDGAMPRREFLTLATSFGLGAAAAYALLGEAAAQTQGRTEAPAAPPAPARGPEQGVLRVAMPVRALRDPRLFDWPEMGNIARQFCEPLVRYRRDGALIPWLLASWEVSPDSKEFLLRLREGVTWSNGDPFEAADVVALIARWCDADIPENSMADRFAAFVDPATNRLRDGAAEIVDTHAVRLFAARSDVSLIASMTDYAALATHRDFDAAGADLQATPIGTGPFELVSLVEGERAELKRRETGWWGGAARLQGVVFRDLGLEPAALKQAAAVGEVDLVLDGGEALSADLTALGLVESRTDSAATVVIRANRAAPPFDDPRVMAALQRAVDNAEVLKQALGGAGEAADNHHVWPKHPDFAPIPPAPPADPKEAKRLLKEAGQEKLELEFVAIADDWRGRVMDAVAEQIEKAGVKVTRKPTPSRLFWEGWTTHPFAMTEWAMRPLGVQVLALAYKTGAAWNESAYSDEAFDALLEVALEVSDLATQRLVMKRLEARLRDSGAIIQPFWRAVRLHHAAGLKGVEVHPMMELQLETAYFDL